MSALDEGQVDAYVERLGLDPGDVRTADRDVESVARLQSAHVRQVPFENLSISGNPFGDAAGEGVTLDPQRLYEKIVEERRGGYCFELNGLFTSLLEALGYAVHRAAAVIVDAEGEHRVPANHHVVIASLDRPYVVDVGMGSPQMHRPTPLDGAETPENAAGVRWRVVDNDRPAYDRRMQYRFDDGGWETRYHFDPTPRDLTYFEAACDYLSTAPESPFTDRVVVRREVEAGWLELDHDTFARVEHGERTEREVSPEEWDEVLRREFGLTVPE